MSLFKNIIVYRIGAGWQAPELEALESVLQTKQFVPCGPTEQASAGWVPPRAEDHAALAESIAGQLILKLAVERKSVPAGAVKAELELRCKAIEAATGRKPGKKEKQQLKDDVTHDLMPRAFSKHSSHAVWLDVQNLFLVVGAGSEKAADQVVTGLIDAMAEVGHPLTLALLSTVMAPSSAMAQWLLSKEAPSEFSVDRDLELRLLDGEKSVVRYARHALDLDEVSQHIAEGKVPTQLAMTWSGRVSFMLTAGLALKKIEILEIEVNSAPEEGGFDADVAIATGELAGLLPDLLLALGGEVEEAAPTTAPTP